jgi:hypothetical protein
MNLVSDCARYNHSLESTGLKFSGSSQSGLLKHTQLFLRNQLFPAIQVGRYTFFGACLKWSALIAKNTSGSYE